MSEMLAPALDLAVIHGRLVFPATPVEKKSHKAARHSGGRRWGATRDPDEIRIDFTRWPRARIGVVTGADSGIVVIETDTLAGHNVDGAASLRALELKHAPLPDTLLAESPSGSVHRYFGHPGAGIKIRTVSSDLGPGIDTRGDGGMVIAPPSITPDKGVLPLAQRSAGRAAAGLADRADAGEAANDLTARRRYGVLHPTRR